MHEAKNPFPLSDPYGRAQLYWRSTGAVNAVHSTHTMRFTGWKRRLLQTVSISVLHDASPRVHRAYTRRRVNAAGMRGQGVKETVRRATSARPPPRRREADLEARCAGASRGARSAGSGAAGFSTSVTRAGPAHALARPARRSQRVRARRRLHARARGQRSCPAWGLHRHAHAAPRAAAQAHGSAGAGALLGVLARRDVGERRLAGAGRRRRSTVLGGDEGVAASLASPGKRLDAIDTNASRRPSRRHRDRTERVDDVVVDLLAVPGPCDALDLHPVEVQRRRARRSRARAAASPAAASESPKSLRFETNAMRRPSAEITTGLIAPGDRPASSPASARSSPPCACSPAAMSVTNTSSWFPSGVPRHAGGVDEERDLRAVGAQRGTTLGRAPGGESSGLPAARSRAGRRSRR